MGGSVSTGVNSIVPGGDSVRKRNKVYHLQGQPQVKPEAGARWKEVEVAFHSANCDFSTSARTLPIRSSRLTRPAATADTMSSLTRTLVRSWCPQRHPERILEARATAPHGPQARS